MVKQLLLAGGLFVSITASATNVINSCGWNHPGLHPYKGGATNGVDDYQDIPIDVRTVLKHKIDGMQFDDRVLIQKGAITGGYSGTITDMHFGANSVCRNVDRDAWRNDHSEVGLVYCADGYCIIVPTVCGNISRIRRVPKGETGEVIPYIPRPKTDGVPLPGLEPHGGSVLNPMPTPITPVQPIPTGTIPEPSTIALMGLGLLFILFGVRRN